jgi:hypothetical protein
LKAVSGNSWSTKHGINNCTFILLFFELKAESKKQKAIEAEIAAKRK